MNNELIGIILLVVMCGLSVFLLASAFGGLLAAKRKEQFGDEEWDDEWNDG